MKKLRVAVVGAGGFGRHHLRVLSELANAELVAVVDSDAERRAKAAEQYGCLALAETSELVGKVDAAVVAVPTTAHAEVGCELLSAGIDVLVEKPIAPDLVSAQALTDTAAKHGRILQVGHLERFNPAVQALAAIVNLPLFFEIHRLSLFSPRSLDVDVVLDLMIHDIDILLWLTRAMPEEVRAAGITILSKKVDIANVRLAFPGGCVANLTASRVSTERVRKIRLFQPNQYISLDYHRQDVYGFTVADGQVEAAQIPVVNQEPLRLELEHFLGCVESRRRPLVSGEEATRALELSLTILRKIDEHLAEVAETIRRHTASTEVTGATLGAEASS